jgi:hypothetical protein
MLLLLLLLMMMMMMMMMMMNMTFCDDHHHHHHHQSDPDVPVTACQLWFRHPALRTRPAISPLSSSQSSQSST